MANKRARSLKRTATNGGGFRDRAIAEYHELLAADETLTPATFEKLRSAMRKNRLLYGDRPIGIALRPHLLDQKQFRALTLRQNALRVRWKRLQPQSCKIRS